MRSELQRRFEAIERQRDALQSSVLALDDAQVNWTPNADMWGVGQIVQHLVLSDETVGQVCGADTVETEAPMFRVLPRAWRRALVLGALRRDKTLPLPSPDIEPREKVPLSELLGRWSAARGEMGRVLNTMTPGERRYAHPVLGPLTAAQMLELGAAHTAYHTRQMEKLQRDPAFPRPKAAAE